MAAPHNVNRNFNRVSINQAIASKLNQFSISPISALAKKKGLVVQKNLFSDGWCVKLPDGSHYNAKDEKDLSSYVRGY